MDLVNIKLRPMSELESESKPMQRRLNGAGHRRAWREEEVGEDALKECNKPKQRTGQQKEDSKVISTGGSNCICG